MIHFGWAIGALFLGGIIGLFIASTCSVSAQADRMEEKIISGVQGKEN